MSVFYENFLNLCAASNKTPSGVAASIGLSNAAATGWKRGKTPSQTTLAKLSEYFGVSVSELMSENKTKPAPVSGSELDVEAMINNMSREDLIEFIVSATSRLKNME